MKKLLSTILAAALVTATSAYADAVVSSAKGEVRVANSAVIEGQRVFSGNTVTLGPNSQAVLKFDDNTQVALDQNTTFRIADFRYNAKESKADRAVFDLLRGALRFVTGVIGARNRQSVAIRVPQATIGIRGTDFMVVLVNPAFVNVLSGQIATSNSAGTVVFGQGAVGQIASSSALAVPTTTSALPAAASSAFSRLAGLQMAAGAAAGAGAGGSAGAATATAGTASGTAGVGAAIAIGVGVGIAITATDSEPTVAPTHH